MSKLRLVLAVTAAALSLTAGCGGHPAGPSAPPPDDGSAAVAGRGRAVCTIDWPEPARLIPSACSKIKVAIYRPGQAAGDAGSLLTSQSANRPSGGGSTTLTFGDLPVGELRAEAAAYPDSGMTGTPQAAGATPLIVAEGQDTVFAVTIASTVASFAIAPQPATVMAGRTTSLTATAKDSSDRVVLLPDVTWTVADGTTLLALGAPQQGTTHSVVVTGTAKGTATVQANCPQAADDPSPLAATVQVDVIGPAATPTATPARVYVGNYVQFGATATPTLADGWIVKYEWDYQGDGTYDYSSTTSPAASYYYLAPQDYQPVIRVTDDQGAQVTATVQVHVSSGYEFVSSFGSYGSGPGQFKRPAAVDLDDDGNVYVAEYDNSRIQKFTSDWRLVNYWSVARARAVLVVSGLGRVYELSHWPNGGMCHDTAGNLLFSWAGNGSGDGQLRTPGGLEINATGQILVADDDNHRIQVFSADGSFLAKWGTQGSAVGQLSRPVDVAVDSQGLIYVSEDDNRRVQVFTPEGEYVRHWSGLAGASLSDPRDVAIDANDFVYVADYGNDRIQKFTSAGTLVTFFGSRGSGDGQFDGPHGLVVAPNGNVLVADIDNHRIQIFRPVPP